MTMPLKHMDVMYGETVANTMTLAHTTMVVNMTTVTKVTAAANVTTVANVMKSANVMDVANMRKVVNMTTVRAGLSLKPLAVTLFCSFPCTRCSLSFYFFIQAHTLGATLLSMHLLISPQNASLLL
jgi:hypothetical protein